MKLDDYFRSGPIEMARFGRETVIRSNWEKEEFERYQNTLVSKLPEIKIAINTLISDISDRVRKHQPLDILHRAFREMLALNANTDGKYVQSVLSLEYIQNLVAAIDQDCGAKEKLTDKKWVGLSDRISKLYEKVNFEYFSAESARLRTKESVSLEEDRIRYMAQVHWITVRGVRYSVHEVPHLKDLLLCHSESLEKAFGITADFLISEISKIFHSLTYGFYEAVNRLREIDEGFSKEFQKRKKESDTQSRTKDHFEEYLEKNQLAGRFREAMGQFHGFHLFDLGKVTELPNSFLDLLSWRPGEDKEFLAEGEFKGWPLRITPVSRRPFLKYDERYYCFSFYALFNKFYRTIQRTVIQQCPDQKVLWMNRQKENTELLPFVYLRRLLPGCREFKQINYKWYPRKNGAKKDWCETDGLVLFGDHLIIIEVKAGAFTYTSPADDFEAYVKSIENLLLRPSDQGTRFLDYFNSAEKVNLYDEDKIQVGKLERNRIRKVTICALTIDPFTEISSQIQHLKGIGIDIGTAPTWSVSLDDLRVCSEIFLNPLIFLHYLENRIKASKNPDVRLSDEVDHIGFYFLRNNYSLFTDNLKGKSDAHAHMFFDGCRDKIDCYYRERLLNPDLVSPFNQKFPIFFKDIIDYCSKNPEPFVELVCFLLGADQNCRNQISEAIAKALKMQARGKRSCYFSTIGENRISIASWQPFLFPHDSDNFRKYSKTEMFCHNELDRKIMELYFDEKNKLLDLQWENLSMIEILPDEANKFRELARQLKKRRLDKYVRNHRKIGRNTACPCGSGKKYKKCCGS